MSGTLPVLFLSHGAPDLLLSVRPAARDFRALGARLPRPKRIIVVSAHWITDPVRITGAAHPELIYDFYGFPDPLYELEYPAPGNPALAARVEATLREAGIDAAIDHKRGLDHGAWSPLMMFYPDADIPIVQVSLPRGPVKRLIELGEALGTLRDDGTLIVCSGGAVHNLHEVNLRGETAAWAQGFDDWLRMAVEEIGFDAVAKPERWPADFAKAHPTPEHYEPLVVAWAAGGRNTPGMRIHTGFDYGNISMSCFAFGTDIPDTLRPPNAA